MTKDELGKTKRNAVYLYIDIDGTARKAFLCESRSFKEICRNNYMGEVIQIPLDNYDCVHASTFDGKLCCYCAGCNGGA